MPKKTNEALGLFGLRDCGDRCRHFDRARRRCGARSVKAQAHYHMVCSGMNQGDCEWFQERNGKETK